MDVRTLLIADLALQIGCSLVLQLMSRSLSGMQGLRWLSWAYVAATAGMGMALNSALAGQSASWEMEIGRWLALLAAVLVAQCAAEFTVPRASVLGWGAGLLGAYALVGFTVLTEPQHYLAGISAFCLAFGAQLMVAVLLLFSNDVPGERMPTRATGTMIAGISALCFARAILAPLRGISTNLLANDNIRFFGLLGFMLFVSGMAFGFIWMMMARLRHQLESQARTDSLTGVLNRRAVEVSGERLLQECRRRAAPLSVLAIDLDHFKELNDGNGHGAGDLVLSAAAHVLSQNLRATDLLARYGGEEFLAVLPERDGARAMAIAERLRGRLGALRVEFEGKELGVTASFGVAMLAAGGDDWDALLRRADRALYEAKQAGRNCSRHGVPELGVAGNQGAQASAAAAH